MKTGEMTVNQLKNILQEAVDEGYGENKIFIDPKSSSYVHYPNDHWFLDLDDEIGISAD